MGQTESSSSSAGGGVYGVGMTQEDMMKKDECILVDEDDNMTGHASKKDAHIFGKKSPRGQLHRAFSVFLFNKQGKLLLQKRASDKITFPDVWTNTCCSHPLYGYSPSEVDEAADVSCGVVNGAKAAAVRKLEHELGIVRGTIPADAFKYLTRLHYWAADVVTHGAHSPWGEHEIDYILFAQVHTDIQIAPNTEEVGDTKWVTLKELQKMMSPKSGLLWSPWFRIIAEQFLPHWWADLSTTLTTSKFCDFQRIHRFDPSEEHMGGAGAAGAWLGLATSPFDSAGTGAAPKAKTAEKGTAKDKGLKQGAYGKVKIHKHSKLDQVMRLDEVAATLRVLTFGANMSDKVDLVDDDTKFCNEMLGKVSRCAPPPSLSDLAAHFHALFCLFMIFSCPPSSFFLQLWVTFSPPVIALTPTPTHPCIDPSQRSFASCPRACASTSSSSTSCCARSTQSRTTWRHSRGASRSRSTTSTPSTRYVI